MKNTSSLLLFVALISLSGPSFSQQQTASANELIVGYYGRPGASSLGVLGQYSIEELMPLVQAKAQEFEEINGGQKVTPAFHLIYGLASADPGRHKDYLLPLSHEKLMAYINAAQSNGFLVIIDTQLGALKPVDAVQAVLKYLKYENVHLAIDPEFEVNGLDTPPGKVIGHISGAEINQVQSAMTDYMDKNGIAGNKMLIVHTFTQNMLENLSVVEQFKHIKLVMNLDGHGSAMIKVKIYNELYTANIASKMAGGFKLFFKEDKPSLMSPKQVLGLEAVGRHKIDQPPVYINYQ